MTTTPECRACGQPGLKPFLSLGQTPLANGLLRADQLDALEPTYPLDVGFCPHCSLVQLLESVPPEQLFLDYVYFSSFSDAMLSHARQLAGQMTERLHLDRNSLVVEAASNDGYLLRNYRDAGVPVLGIEPARNIAAVAQDQNGIPTVSEFFGKELADTLVADGKRADLFHAHNVLAHVPDLNGFVAGIRALLKDDGWAVIEVPYLKELLDHCEFDTIYHEHLCYFSVTALDRCFRRHGLRLVDVGRIDLHGGSLQLHLTPHCTIEAAPAVAELLAEEAAWGVDRFETYETFGRHVLALRAELRQQLQGLKERGLRIAAYGASAKGSTLLNYCGIGRETLDFVVDRSTAKQNRYTPGTHLPIHPPEYMLETMPDVVLLLSWNFADEILRQQAEYRRRGGRFLIPIPHPRVA
jgi:hypothetical protein